MIKKKIHSIFVSLQHGDRDPSGRRRILFLSASVLLVCIVCSFFLVRFIIRNNTTIVGFYDLQEKYVTDIESLMDKAALRKIKIIPVTEKDVLSGKLAKKYDILFVRSGALASSLSGSAVSLSSVIQSRYPSTIRDSSFFAGTSKSGVPEFRVMPILLDHFEVSYFKVLMKDASLKNPEDLSRLEAYGAICRKYLQNPCVCAGALDENLFGLISAMIESFAGKDGYVDFVKQLTDAKNFDEALSVPIGGDAPAGTTFAWVLDMIRRWQKDSIILPDWYKTAEQTVTITMEDNHAAVVFMSLSEHRRKPFPMIRYFEGGQFPPATGKTRSVVAPAVCAMMFRETESAKTLMSMLSSEEWQSALSVATRLAPATLRGEAVDIQADDVRFFAASMPGGPVPDIGMAAFKDSSRRSAFANEIRTYLSQY